MQPDRSLCRAQELLFVMIILWTYLLQAMTQSKVVAKSLNQHHAPVVSQVTVAERKMQCSQAFGHRRIEKNASFSLLTQTPLLVDFVSTGRNRALARKFRDGA